MKLEHLTTGRAAHGSEHVGDCCDTPCYSGCSVNGPSLECMPMPGYCSISLLVPCTVQLHGLCHPGDFKMSPDLVFHGELLWFLLLCSSANDKAKTKQGTLLFQFSFSSSERFILGISHYWHQETPESS